MIRALVIVAVGGLVMSVVLISAALAIGGPEVISRGAWNWDMHWDGHHHHFGHPVAPLKDEATRDVPWTGGEALEINAPADVAYVQAAGPAKLTISGPKDLLDRVQVEGGRVTLEGMTLGRGLHVALTAPGVKRFTLNGAERLAITGYKQDTLSVVVGGHAKVEAQGQADTLKLDLSGAGVADFGQLTAKGADIDISGAGQVTAAPSDWARVKIAGVGDVDLLTRPSRLETQIDGAGRIHQPGDADRHGPDDDDRDDDAGPARST